MVLNVKPGNYMHIKIFMGCMGKLRTHAVPDPFGAHNFMIRIGIVSHVPPFSG